MQTGVVSCRLAVCGLLLFASSGCERMAELTSRLTGNAPEESALRPMPLGEVSLLVRSGHPQDSIVAEVKQRRVDQPLTPAIEKKLIEEGAQPHLLAALKDRRNVKRQKNTEVAALTTSAATQAEAAEQERKRRLALQQETLRQIDERQRKQAAYEQDVLNYENQRKALQNSIDGLQKQRYGITNGAHNAAEIQSLNEQLRALTPPVRP